ncbi:MAG: hypothetical protein MRY83_15865, partial [Flavobacteriales bacterium]|nr:hypothetical protein [Flavobacteriales bacterium]
MFDISFINRCKFFSFLILIVFGFHSNAQRYQFISHSVDDGLIWTQVRSIYQDSRGYLWIGTLGGLSRFDGDEFKNYSVKDGLLGNHIECIYEDDQGQLWFGTLNGVSKYDGLTFESIEVDVFRDHFVRDIQQDKKGNYWFSSDGSGICLYDAKGDSLTNFREDDGLINNFVRTSTMLDDGSILFGTREGISRFQNNQFSQLGIPVLDTSSISEIQGTDLSNLSVSAYGIGLVKVNNEGTIIFDRSKGLQTNNIRGFVQYKNDYWTFSARGISHITPDTIYNYDKASGLPTTDIRCGLIDKDENIWIGSNGEGLLKFIGRHFISFSENNGLSSNEVMSFIEDEEGKIWLSTLNQGLMTYSNKGFEYLNMSNSGLPTNSIFSSYKDNSGNLWFGSDLGPLKLDNKTFINIYDKFNLSPSRAYS